MIPATKLASVWRAAKPMIAAAIAPDASRLAARRLMPPNCEQRDRHAEQEDRRVEQAPQEAQAGVGLRAQGAARHRAGEIACRGAPAAGRTRSPTTAASTSDAAAQIQLLVEAPKGIAWAPAMAAQGSPGVVRAVLLDALGTLLELLPPAPRLRAALAERAGLDVDEAAAARAMAAEIRFYRAHLHEGGTAAGLASLRERCAEVVREALGEPARALGSVALQDALLAALEFRAFPDAPGALDALRSRGVRLVVVSNWDLSLHERLAQTGLAGRLDGAVASAEIGSAKPDPAIFRHALALAGGVAPAAALHVGDTPGADVAGARAAGVWPVLLARGGGRGPDGVPTIASLRELEGLLG